MTENDNGDEALDPASMLALAQKQQHSVGIQRGSFAATIMGAWGIAWLLGFIALWLIDGLRPAFGIPIALGVWIFIVLLAAAIAVSAVLGTRGSRGVRTSRASSFTGTVYGVTWSVASIGLVAIGGGLYSHGMTAQLANFFYPSAFIFLAGVMYISAGAIWHSVPSVVGGGVLIVVSAVGIYLPYPAHYLFFAIAGGGTFLGLAIQSALRTRRSRVATRG
jgi:hypothetical protein